MGSNPSLERLGEMRWDWNQGFVNGPNLTVAGTRQSNVAKLCKAVFSTQRRHGRRPCTIQRTCWCPCRCPRLRCCRLRCCRLRRCRCRCCRRCRLPCCSCRAENYFLTRKMLAQLIDFSAERSLNLTMTFNFLSWLTFRLFHTNAHKRRQTYSDRQTDRQKEWERERKRERE